MDSGPRRLHELSRAESLRLLDSLPYGRVVFTELALPAIRPVKHVLIDDWIIINADLGPSALSGTGVVVAYEADAIDPDKQVGWSVIVTGMAEVVHDPHEAARYLKMLRPWTREPHDRVIRISPELVAGFELAAEPLARQAS